MQPSIDKQIRVLRIRLLSAMREDDYVKIAHINNSILQLIRVPQENQSYTPLRTHEKIQRARKSTQKMLAPILAK